MPPRPHQFGTLRSFVRGPKAKKGDMSLGGGWKDSAFIAFAPFRTWQIRRQWQVRRHARNIYGKMQAISSHKPLRRA